MTKTHQLDIFDALAARDAAIARGQASADAEEAGWTDAAYALLLEYARTHTDFLTEDVRIWAHEIQGLSAPPDGRAWGGIVLRACRAGVLERAGFRPMRSRNCHGNPKSVWRSTVFNRA